MSLTSVPEMILLSCIIMGIFMRSASGISCYQCLSTDHTSPFQCNEYLDDVDIVPQSCDAVYGAQYCIKRTGRFEGGLGTKRFCSSLDLGNYCNYIQQPGDVMEYRSCVYTCSTEGCNHSTSIKALSFSTLISISIAYFYM